MATGTRWRPSRRTALIVGISLVVAILLGYVFLFSPLLAVRKVQLVGGDRFGSAQLQAMAGSEMGVPLARVDLASLQRRVTSEPAVKSARVVRVWPHTLEVRVTERIPVVAVPVLEKASDSPDHESSDSQSSGQQSSGQGSSGGGSAGQESTGDSDSTRKTGAVELMAADGVVIETVTEMPEGLPAVTTETVEAGKEAVESAAEVVSALPDQLRAEVTEVSATSRDSVMLTMEVPPVASAEKEDGKSGQGESSESGGSESEGAEEPETRTVTVVWGAVEDSPLKAEVLGVLLQADAKVYDVSSPSTPVTRDSAAPVPSKTADPPSTENSTGSTPDDQNAPQD